MRPSTIPPLAVHDDAVREKARTSHEMLAGHVDIVELAALERKDRGIARPALPECAEIAPLQRSRRPLGRRAHDFAERHAEAKEFRHRGQKIERGAIDTQGMNV